MSRQAPEVRPQTRYVDVAGAEVAYQVREGPPDLIYVPGFGNVDLPWEDPVSATVTDAKQVCDLAGPGQVLVSRTVADLVAGSSIEFEDRGERELKGVPRAWRLDPAVP